MLVLLYLLVLASGFVPLIAYASFDYVWVNGLIIGLPVMFFSIVALVAVIASKKIDVEIKF
jgi:hypothetical protein